jgi:hypothetical protein
VAAEYIPQMGVNKTGIEADAATSVTVLTVGERTTSVARDVLEEHVRNER